MVIGPRHWFWRVCGFVLNGALVLGQASAQNAEQLPPELAQKLVLWVSADSEAARRGLEKAHTDALPLEVWHDQSARRHHLAQANSQHQPKLVRLDAAEKSHWLVRFDGQDDYLRCEQFGSPFTQFSIFVVAAVHSNIGKEPLHNSPVLYGTF